MILSSTVSSLFIILARFLSTSKICQCTIAMSIDFVKYSAFANISFALIVILAIDALWEYCYQPEDKGNGYWMGNGYEHPKIQGKIVPWKQVQSLFLH